MSEEQNPAIKFWEVPTQAPTEEQAEEAARKVFGMIDGMIIGQVTTQGSYDPPEALEMEVVFPPTKAGRKALERLREALEGLQQDSKQE
jgi:hypothetical protein